MGKTRLSRWYVAYNDDERRKLEIEAHRLVVNRDNKMACFLEVSQNQITSMLTPAVNQLARVV